MKNILVLLALVIAGCTASNQQLYDREIINKTYLTANLEFLASDELEGREATTRAEKISALFLASELKKYGVQELEDYESYLMEFTILKTNIDTNSYIKSGDGMILSFPDEFIADLRKSASISGYYDIVFAGFGITAPEFGYNDYENLDVAGKWVIVWKGEPQSSDPDFFDANYLTTYSMSDHKIDNAKSRNAAGIILLAEDQLINFWDAYRSFFTRSAFSLMNSEVADNDSFAVLYIRNQTAKKLFSEQEYEYEKIEQLTAGGHNVPKFSFNNKIFISLNKLSTNQSSYNVIGYREGEHPQLKNEYIAIGAHYDHLGVREDRIYNGADDNGSGTVAVLEVARALSETGGNKRSVLFVFHGAEEKGLLGSRYLSDNFYLMDNIQAHINLDMVGRESVDTIYSVGSDKINPRLKNIVEETNRNTVNFALNYKFDDSDDPHRIYYRSDHYHYARKGIPIVFFYDFMMEDYHKPGDTVDKINFEKIRKVAELVYHLTLNLANEEEQLRPDETTIELSLPAD